MIRSKDAPIETAKYMGHGVCDYVTKSQSLSDFTGSLDTIIKTVFGIKNVLNIAPDQLRGIGIHIGRLDVDTTIPSNVVNKKSTTNLLKSMFERVKEKNAQKSVNETTTPTSATKKTEPIPKKKAEIPSKTTPQNNYKSKLRARKPPKQIASSTRDVSTMLTNIKPKSRKVSSIDYENIDMKILMELPENIRNEILDGYKQQPQQTKKVVSPKKSNDQNCIDPEFLAALPDDIRIELLAENKRHKVSIKNEKPSSPIKSNNITESSKQPKEEKMSPEKVPLNCDTVAIQLISPENVLVKMNWRDLLQEWIDSSNEPLTGDIETISLHAKELVLAPKLNELYIGLRYLFR